MIDINSYIIEKLRINDKTKLVRGYHAGDRCLVLSCYNWKNEKFMENDRINCVSLDVMEISSVNDEQMQFNYITTNIHTNDKLIKQPKRKESDYFFFDFNGLAVELMLPNDESIEAIEYIEKHKKYNIFKKLEYIPKGCEYLKNEDLPVTFDSDHKVIDFDKSKIKKIKNLLYDSSK